MSQIPKVNIGIIGAGTMCRAHSLGYDIMPKHFWPCPAIPVKKLLCDINLSSAKDGAERYGWESFCCNWEEVVESNDIDIVDIVVPNNLHKEICLAAAKQGKMIYCEKPLGLDFEDSLEIYRVIRESGVKNAVAFNKRRWPAVLFTKKLIQEGRIGKIINFHCEMQQSFALNRDLPLTWKFQREKTGGGAIVDIGSHVIDLARFLVGDIDEVCGSLITVIPERPLPEAGTNLFWAKSKENAPVGKVEVDDLTSFMVKFHNGAIGTLEASRVASGKGDGVSFTIWGTEGAIHWNQQMLGQLEVSFENVPADEKGFKTIEICGVHDYGIWNVPFGIGLGENKAIEILDVLNTYVNDVPFHSDFYDGMKVAQIIDAVEKSSLSKSWITVEEIDHIPHQ